jgi:hypothetical protein
MKHSKGKKGLKIFVITASICLALLLAAYGVAVYYFTSHFGFSTSIDSTNCTFKTVAEVEQLISERVDEYQITIKGRENLSKVIKAGDIDLKYVPDGQVERILEAQNPFLWFMQAFKDPDAATTQVSVRFDTNKYNSILGRLGFLDEDEMRPPADAFVEFQGSAYVVHPEDMGTLLDEDKTVNSISEALRGLAPNFDLEAKDCYVDPKVYSDNQELAQTVETYNTYVPFSVTYLFGEEKELLDGATTMDWVVTAPDGTHSLNEDALKAWVRDFGIRHDTVGTTRSFTAATGEQAIVEGGAWGWEIDEDAEVEAIKQLYQSHRGEKREPHYVQRAVEMVPPGTPDWGTTYVELDLTNQHMYYIVDGEIKFEADVVTGAPWGNRATPQGVYSILEMLSPAVLTGEIMSDGKPEYVTTVSFWMRMTWAGHGFHDATWQPWFGGDRYTYAGSHGCINMAYPDAQKLFNMLEEGTPVVSHY